MSAIAAVTSQASRAPNDVAGFRPWRWAAYITLFCAVPLVLLLCGVDFSSGQVVLSVESVTGASASELGELAHRAMRGSYTHTILEWTAVCGAVFVMLLAFVQFRLTKEPSLPVIGIALACAGAMDAFHTLAADRLIEAVADNHNLIPFTWAICRLFNGAILLVGVGIFAFGSTAKAELGRGFILGTSLCFMASAYFIIHLCATSNTLPATMFPDAVIKRPYDLYPLIPYLLCGLVIFPMYLRAHRTLFAYTLLLSIIPHVATQLYMAFGSDRLHDSCFNIAHGLKAFSYMVPILGLSMEYVSAYHDREIAETRLRKQSKESKLLHRLSLGEMGVMGEESFDEVLQQCVDTVCEVMEWPVGHAYLPANDGTGELAPTTIWHVDDAETFARFRSITEQTRFKSGIGLPGRVLERGESAWIADVTLDDNFPRAKASGHLGIKGGFAFPIQVNGVIVAVLEFFTVDEIASNEQTLRLAHVISQQLSEVLERRQSVKALRDSEARTGAIVDTAVGGIITIDEVGTIESLNPSAERMFGHTPEELIGKNIKMLMPPPYAEAHDGYLSNYLRTGERKIIGIGREVVGLRKDGSTFPMELSISEMRLSDRRLFTGVVRDITERKQAEEELLRAAEVLEGRTLDLEFAQAHLKKTAEFGAALNQTSEKVTYEMALRCILEYTESPLAVIYTEENGGALSAKCSIGVDSKPLDAELFSSHGLPGEVMRSGEFQTVVGPFPSANLHLSVGICDIEPDRIIGWPILFQEECIGVLVTVHTADVTEDHYFFVTSSLSQLAIRINSFRQEAHRRILTEDLQAQSVALESAKLDAERASKVKSEFLANMSHELRTPMNSIMGFTQRLIKRLNESIPERDLDALQTVDRNAKHLLGLINDILDLSKIEADKMDLEFMPFDVASAIQEVVQQTASLTDEKPVEVTFDASVGPIEIEADLVKTRQIVMNLLSNAIKYTDEGTVTVSVSLVKDGELGTCARISVKDTGVGISAEDQKRLFQTFTQLDASSKRRAGGTGLGLVITARYVQMHGGRVDVESEAGVGSTFTVYLPKDRDAVKASSADDASVAVDATPAPPCGITILCVDDDRNTFKCLQQTLEKEGYAFECVETAEAGLEALDSRLFDLVLMDISLPGMDGTEATRQLRSDPKFAKLPIIAVTAHAAKGEEDRIMASGVSALVTKPIDEAVLLETIKLHLTGEATHA